MAAGVGLSVETVIFVLAGFVWLRARGYTLAEAGAIAILVLFMALSLIHQIDLYIGSPVPGLVLELTALGTVGVAGLRRPPSLSRLRASVWQLVRRETLPGAILLSGWTVMAVFVGMGWGAAEKAGSFPSVGAVVTGWMHGSPSLAAGHQAIVPLNAAALFYHTARFGLPPAACGFGILAHMAVGFSTYALARRYAWPAMALTVTLMVLSMPRLVFSGLHPSAESIAAAAIAVCLLLLYRLVEQHQVRDLRLYALCLMFSIHAHPMSVALALVMAALLTLVMIRRHGWLLWREMLSADPMVTLLLLPLAAALAQIPVFALNLARNQPPFGTAAVFDTDGIIGAAANLIRYLFISIDPTEAVRRALAWLVGLDLGRLMTLGYNALVVSLFGRSGASAPFVPVFSGGGRAGFGPFAPLLVLPAMIHAALRGPRRLKAVNVAWGGYLYLTALVFAWTTDNLAVLSPVFAANGFVVAFWLPPWRLRRRGMRLLQALFALLLAGSLWQWGGT